MNSNYLLTDKFSRIKEMLSGYKDALFNESCHIMKVAILEVVKEHRLIKMSLGVSHCYQMNPFFRDSQHECDQITIPNFFTLSGEEESIFLRENRTYVHYVNARLLIGEGLVRKFLDKTLKLSDL